MSERISVRFKGKKNKENLSEIEEIAEKEFDGNLSETVRNVLEYFIYLRNAPEYIDRRELYFAKNDIGNMEKVIELGYATDKGDLIRAAVNDYLRKKRD